ncbi:MAG: mycothiol synthase [Acidimicrobiaceae bacterium]|nr:mycothiol synthase [Acidimicrobiaceae bacterium]MYL04467.1 mycothiol synthase [Acidimicrobiaceae bacterium]
MVEFAHRVGVLEPQPLVGAPGSALGTSGAGHRRDASGTLNPVRYEVNPPAKAGGAAQVVVYEGRAAGELAAILDESLAGLDAGDGAQLWIREVAAGDDETALRHGFEPYRDLWQLRCRLPAEASGLATRAFTIDDMDEFVTVNNRAFHWHPEQGGIGADDVRDRMAEPWFDADGFRLHHRDDRLAGFCWTKVHPDHDPPLGEIYVIAVDPDFAGRGLGRPMTLAGLEWLSARGLAVGMLYVESDNHPANAVYRRIGFERHHTDRAYRRQPR